MTTITRDELLFRIRAMKHDINEVFINLCSREQLPTIAEIDPELKRVRYAIAKAFLGVL